MAQTPEQKVHSALKSLLASRLPKGRWLLQRIETSTGTGIPDNYFSLLNWGSMWIETKTVDYIVSHEQLNWAYQHALTGGLTYIVTRVSAAKTTIKHTPTTRPRAPSASSNIPTHTLTYPALLNLYKMPAIPVDNGIVSYDQLTNTPQKKSQETLIFLAFDDRMRECSTLGSYLRKFNPDVLPVESWAQCIKSRPSQ